LFALFRAPDPRPWNIKLQGAMMLFAGLVGVVAGAALVFFDYRNSAELRAYQSAAQCQAATDAVTTDTCLYSGQATVAGTSRGSTLSVDLTFASLPGRAFTATFPADREPPATALESRGTGQAELWNGLVTRYAGANSVQNPEYLPKNLTPAGLILLVVGLSATGYAVLRVRQAWA
jgi:hypothetical protein